MIGGCTDDGQAERDIHTLIKIQRLQRDECLIVIHGNRDVIGAALVRCEQGVGRVWTTRIDAVRPKLFDCGSDGLDLFGPHSAIFTRMWD